jgi:hypothetical protein
VQQIPAFRYFSALLEWVPITRHKWSPDPTGNAGAKLLNIQAFHKTIRMTRDDEHILRDELARLQQEHRDLDTAIEALTESLGRDQIQVQRLKKRKLILRDRIAFIEDQLTPDISA